MPRTDPLDGEVSRVADDVHKPEPLRPRFDQGSFEEFAAETASAQIRAKRDRNLRLFPTSVNLRDPHRLSGPQHGDQDVGTQPFAGDPDPLIGDRGEEPIPAPLRVQTREMSHGPRRIPVM